MHEYALSWSTSAGFERDLASYTKYCQEIIFPSADLRWDEEKVRKRLQRIFEKPSKQVGPGAKQSDSLLLIIIKSTPVLCFIFNF